MEVSGKLHVPVGWPPGKIPRYELTRKFSVPSTGLNVSEMSRPSRESNQGSSLVCTARIPPSLKVSSKQGQCSANHQAMYCLYCCLLLKLITCKRKGIKRCNIPAGRNYYYPRENTLHFYYKHTLGNQLPSVLSSKPTPRMDYREQISRCVTLKKMVHIFTTATSRVKLQLYKIIRLRVWNMT